METVQNSRSSTQPIDDHAHGKERFSAIRQALQQTAEFAAYQTRALELDRQVDAEEITSDEYLKKHEELDLSPEGLAVFAKEQALIHKANT